MASATPRSVWRSPPSTSSRRAADAGRLLVDWLGARVILIIGLLIGAAAFVVVGLVDSFWVLVAMFGLAGVGNTVYHPADYALLSHHVSPERIGQAFSIHTFAGILGSALAPASLLLMQSVWGWRGAFYRRRPVRLCGRALLLLFQRRARRRRTAPRRTRTPPRQPTTPVAGGC